jgi:N-acetylmuramic acid 6-phosphate etherase
MNELFRLLERLATESVNPWTREIDLLDARQIVGLLHAEDRTVADAVAPELDHIADLAERVAGAFRQGGRLIYVGAGTSGRLGVVDASECPPTYGTDPDMVLGVIAGGQGAMFRSVEGAEDRPDLGAKAMDELGLQQNDAVIGISASGRTPFVIGALRHADEVGAVTGFVTTNAREVVSPLAPFVDVLICAEVGPEPVTGSTRMKSGTAQKMILNMISTTAMVRIGKTFGNVMVDLQQTNEKLRERSKRIIMTIADVDYTTASDVLRDAGGHVKTALVMAMANVSADEALRRLSAVDGFVRKAL